MFGQRPKFAWITSNIYREVIASDYEEMELCFSSKAYKACHIMSGSIMEAALGYGLKRLRVNFSPESTLSEFLELSKKHKLLPQSEAHYGQALRYYRNLIHPHKYMEEKRDISKESAAMVRETCQYMLQELEKCLANYLPLGYEIYLGQERGKSVSLYQIPFTLGRGAENHCVIADDRISTNHARILWIKEKFYLEDCQSKNGTYINSDKGECRIKPGARVELLCGTKFRLGKQEDLPYFTFLISGETIGM